MQHFKKNLNTTTNHNKDTKAVETVTNKRYYYSFQQRGQENQYIDQGWAAWWCRGCLTVGRFSCWLTGALCVFACSPCLQALQFPPTVQRDAD